MALNFCRSVYIKVSIYLSVDTIFITCGSYQDLIDGGLLLTRKLLNQGFLLIKQKSSFRRFNDDHHDLVDRYEVCVSQMTTDMFHVS